nr:mutH/Vsr/archaeal HJR-like endonuclease [Marseillevirus cajuinensis]
MPPKKTQEEVSLIFEQKGYKLVGEYTGSACTMEFICSCGGRREASYSRITSKGFSGCKECVRKKRGILTREERRGGKDIGETLCLSRTRIQYEALHFRQEQQTRFFL